MRRQALERYGCDADNLLLAPVAHAAKAGTPHLLRDGVFGKPVRLAGVLLLLIVTFPMPAANADGLAASESEPIWWYFLLALNAQIKFSLFSCTWQADPVTSLGTIRRRSHLFVRVQISQ